MKLLFLVVWIYPLLCLSRAATRWLPTSRTATSNRFTWSWRWEPLSTSSSNWRTSERPLPLRRVSWNSVQSQTLRNRWDEEEDNGCFSIHFLPSNPLMMPSHCYYAFNKSCLIMTKHQLILLGNCEWKTFSSQGPNKGTVSGEGTSRGGVWGEDGTRCLTYRLPSCAVMSRPYFRWEMVINAIYSALLVWFDSVIKWWLTSTTSFLN